MKLGILPLLAVLLFPRLAVAAPVELIVKPETITVGGKTAEVFTIVQPDGTRGLTVNEKDGFHVIVKNQLPFPTTIHWHGLILPNLQDGVPYVTQNPIPPGGQQEYKFPLVQHGTYWMHSHYGLQEQVLTAAPLVILNDVELAKAERQVTVMFSDFSFKTPNQILAALLKPAAPMPKMGGGMNGMAMKNSKPARVQTWNAETGQFVGEVMNRPPTDIDVRYDALLANRRTADDPEIISVKAGETVLLRLIAAGAATNLFVDTGTLVAELLAVDGKAVEPLKGNFFQLALAQRIDLRVRIPAEGGAFPILGLGEGTTLQAGVVLVTKGAHIPLLSVGSSILAGALDNTQELRLRAAQPLIASPVNRELPSLLGGDMATYVWTINDKAYPNRDSLNVAKGERVQMTLTNKTMMSHPMHLHGHDFQVVEIDGQSVSGAMRDTVSVPPGSTMKIQFDANNPGLWAYHCHITYHLARGMFTVVRYDGVDATFWQPEEAARELKENLP